jgi:hypothetical protein
MHQPKFKHRGEKYQWYTSGGERIKGRYDVTIGRGSIVASYGMWPLKGTSWKSDQRSDS